MPDTGYRLRNAVPAEFNLTTAYHLSWCLSSLSCCSCCCWNCFCSWCLRTVHTLWTHWRNWVSWTTCQWRSMNDWNTTACLQTAVSQSPVTVSTRLTTQRGHSESESALNFATDKNWLSEFQFSWVGTMIRLAWVLWWYDHCFKSVQLKCPHELAY